jgi:hypothetical protein
MIGLAGIGLWMSIAPVRANPSDAGEPTPASVAAGTGNVDDDCVYKGIKLAGKVKVVDSFPDVRVKAVSSFPDLKVKKVSSFADRCGEWQFVESFPSFTIQYVDSFPDIEVAWVESFPGLP